MDRCPLTLPGMISISLDAWTSPNGMTFMAIIVNYITNKGKLSEYHNL
jgi:hypothetical protein